MTRQNRMRLLFPFLMIGAQAVCAQDSAGAMRPEPRAVESSPVEWAVAPPGTQMPEGSRIPEDAVLPDGTVLQEAVTLPAGTILPGGAILPKTAAPDAPSVPSVPDEPEVASGVPYISGGIGASGRDEMRELKSKFNLRLLFAIQGSGEYLADVKVRIDDASGPTLLTAVSQGPWFYASLAPGRYQLTVDNAGQTQTREVTVPADGATEQSFYWAP